MSVAMRIVAAAVAVNAWTAAVALNLANVAHHDHKLSGTPQKKVDGSSGSANSESLIDSAFSEFVHELNGKAPTQVDDSSLLLSGADANKTKKVDPEYVAQKDQEIADAALKSAQVRWYELFGMPWGEFKPETIAAVFLNVTGQEWPGLETVQEQGVEYWIEVAIKHKEAVESAGLPEPPKPGVIKPLVAAAAEQMQSMAGSPFAAPAQAPSPGSGPLETIVPLPPSPAPEVLVSSAADDPRPLFGDGWKNMLIDPTFSKTVDSWGGTDKGTCSMQVTHRNVVGWDPKTVTQRPEKKEAEDIKVIEKHIEVEVPKIVEKRIPFQMNVTQDRMIYETTKHKIPKYVPVEKIEKVRREVEVPKVVEVIKNVTTPGPVVPKVVKVKKRVEMDVVTVRVDEIAIPMMVQEERPVYHNVSMKVQRKRTVPKYVNRNVEVEYVKIEEVLRELPASSDPTTASGAPGATAPANEKVEVEVAKVTIKEVKVPVEIIQEKVVYKTIKQRVERKVERPEVRIKQKIVEVPEYKEVVKEVPVIEVRNRTVEVIKEELEIEDVEETVNVTQERVAIHPVTTDKQVSIVTETPEISYEEVQVPETSITVKCDTVNETVDVVEWTNITQEVLNVTEEIEYVDKVVEVIIEQEQIVEVPRYVEKTVYREVLIESIREEIEQVPIDHIVNIIREEPNPVFEDFEVEVSRDEIVEEPTTILKELRQIEIEELKSWTELEVTQLEPTPFPIEEHTQEINFATDDNEAKTGEPHVDDEQNNFTEEIIVQDFVNKEVIKNIYVPTSNVMIRDVHVPVFEVEEEVIEVPTIKYEDDIVEVEKIYEQEKLVQIPGPPTEQVIEHEVIVPAYIQKQVVARIEVPKLTYNKTDVPIPVYTLVEEEVEEELEIFKDVLVPIEKIVKVDRWVNASSLSKNGGALTAQDAEVDSSLISYVEREVVQTMEVAEPVFVTKEVEVPVYEIEEVIVEIPKVTVVEEIVEVPRIVEIEKILEVPTVEYNDIIVEKVLKKHVKQVKQVGKVIYVDKVVNQNTDNILVKEKVVSVPLSVQVPAYSKGEETHTQTFTSKTMSLTEQKKEVTKTKNVVAKKRIERLVPKEVVKVIKKEVDVVKEVLVEKVVPVYKETLVKKKVEVPLMAVKELVVKKDLKRQVLKPVSVVNFKKVPLNIEVGHPKTVTLEVPVRTSLKPVVKTKQVPIAVPCGANDISASPAVNASEPKTVEWSIADHVADTPSTTTTANKTEAVV
eukprot:gb/GFBE01002654.1/.p1 GENE.gb/GFBE01002654.1/~~gb/GFBE01002654.1/.p1  ORF type:complete len:1240 (+),score=421.09 gb/GFBE01002654.1/:1-3720(+)